jgi:hypothetical protein
MDTGAGRRRPDGLVCDVRVSAMMAFDLDHHIVTARRI